MDQIIQEEKEHLIGFFKRFPIAFTRAEGHTLTDINGKTYTDFTAGISVCSLGHANRRVNDAIKDQLDKITHMTNIFYVPGQIELSRKISAKSFNGKSFFCNSGAEANDAAIKISRFLGNKISPKKNKILSMESSFHGRTIATISITGQPKYRQGFEPILPHVDYVKINDMSSLEEKMDENVCAIFLEPVMGEGGIFPLSRSFVAKARMLAQKHQALLVFDEIQAGIARTGKYFGYQWYDVEPDIITLAKALGNGFPIGAVHMKSALADQLTPGLHGTTFGGNFLAIAAANAVMDQLDDTLLTKINELSAYFLERLNALRKDKHTVIGDIRVKGLMIGIDLIGIDVASVIQDLLDRGFVTLRAGDNTLRLLPPFTITKKEIDALLEQLMEIL